MAYGRNAKFEPVREIAFGAIGVAYGAVGTLTTDYTRVLTIKNTTDKDVYFSMDGVTNHKRIISGTAEVIDITTNKVRDDGMFIAKGTVFYVKQASGAPTSGRIVVEVMYAAGGV